MDVVPAVVASARPSEIATDPVKLTCAAWTNDLCCADISDVARVLRLEGGGGEERVKGWGALRALSSCVCRACHCTTGIDLIWLVEPGETKTLRSGRRKKNKKEAAATRR